MRDSRAAEVGQDSQLSGHSASHPPHRVTTQLPAPTREELRRVCESDESTLLRFVSGTAPEGAVTRHETLCCFINWVLRRAFPDWPRPAEAFIRRFVSHLTSLGESRQVPQRFGTIDIVVYNDLWLQLPGQAGFFHQQGDHLRHLGSLPITKTTRLHLAVYYHEFLTKLLDLRHATTCTTDEDVSGHPPSPVVEG